MIKYFTWLLLSLLVACSSAPAPRLPQALEQAQAADKDARRALRGGELLRAQHNFAKALALQQSLDDAAGSAATIINLATVAHQLHDDAAALIWLDKIGQEKTLIYPQELRMTAAFRQAVILTNQARLGEAEAALQRAESLCEKQCPLHFGIDILRARLLLLKGDAAGALTLVQGVSRLNEIGKEEKANAVRVVAEAEEKLLRYTEALQHYQAALEADKSLGLSARIGEDLNGMARVAKLLGRDEEATVYARRAALVAESRRQSAAAVRE